MRSTLLCFHLVTGFDKDEERAGNDRLIDGELFEAKDPHCKAWR